MKAFTFINDDEPLGEIDLIIDSPIPYKPYSCINNMAKWF